MPIGIGQYEIRPSRTLRWIMHKIDHLWYNFSKVRAYGAGFNLRATWYDSIAESDFNRKHGERFPTGSYEVVRHV